MKHVKLEDHGIPFNVIHFDRKTNRGFPYYQRNRRYALCPVCNTSVQIIGGDNNSAQTRQRRVYAAHTPGAVEGLRFDREAKENCPYYAGNNANWQGIYNLAGNNNENEIVRQYIEDNENEIASEIERIIGFRCHNADGVNNLYTGIKDSFIAQGGLQIPNERFMPEYLPRLMITMAEQVDCWGYIPNDLTRNQIEANDDFSGNMSNKQFLPVDFDAVVVGVLDNIQNPTRILVRIVRTDNQRYVEINNVSAKV